MRSPFEDARALLSEALAHRQRRMLRLRGDAEWVREQATSIARVLKGQLTFATLSGAYLELSDRRQLARHELGGELHGLIVDTVAGLDPDALGAALGMVHGGGLILWLELNAPRAGLFAMHLSRALGRSPSLITHTQNGGREVHGSVEPIAVAQRPDAFHFGALTLDQEQAVEQLLTLLKTNAPPLVLLANRGRGKSSALGLFIEQALRRDPLLTVAFSTAHPGARAVVLSRVSEELRARVQIVEPVEAARGQGSAEIVLVDEASTLSVPILAGILAHAKRVAFATTIHGYEGSGQGFRVRFWNALLERHPKTREVWLHEPIRFGRGCPVESFVHDALLLDVGDPAVCVRTQADHMGSTDVQIERIDRASLVHDENLLRGVFGLFVLAHYRTTPSDLEHLLDDQGVSLWVARAGECVLGALWAVEEGGLSEEQALRVAHGQARPRGHMLPEALARHLGEPTAAEGRGLRVVRIAVDAGRRREHTASRLLAQASDFAAQHGLSYVGAGFAATADVLGFWRANQLRVIHVGTKRGPASGEVSAIVLRGLNESTERLSQALEARCVRDFPDQLRDGLRDLDAEVVLSVLSAGPQKSMISEDDERNVQQYALHARPYDTVVSSLHHFVHARALANDLPVSVEARALLVAKILQGRAWPEIASLFHYESVAQAMRAVRHAIRTLL